MAKRKRTTKPVYQQITSKLAQLTCNELDELIEVATVLRETMDKTPEEKDEEFVEQHKEVLKLSGAEQVRRPKRGHVEEKMINGCGPYLYLRHWRGGKLRSTYLGKGRVEEG